MGLLNQVEILGCARPGKEENTFNDIEIVEEYIQDVVKSILQTFGNIFLTSFYKLITLSLNFGLPASKKRPKNL